MIYKGGKLAYYYYFSLSFRFSLIIASSVISFRTKVYLCIYLFISLLIEGWPFFLTRETLAIWISFISLILFEYWQKQMLLKQA